jgi:hypothetical protein
MTPTSERRVLGLVAMSHPREIENLSIGFDCIGAAAR